MLQVLPGRDTNASISMSLAMNASGGWVAAIDSRLSALLPQTGVSVVIDLVVLQVFVGLGALMARSTRLASVIGGIGLSLAYWVTGQDMGQPWSGVATDPTTAPLVVLLGVAVLGSAPWRSGTQPRARRSCGRRDRGPG